MTCWLCGSTKAPTTPTCKNGPCQLCTEVTEVDKEINQVLSNLRHLLSKRCDILSEHNRVHGALIHRFPVELKNRIFELLLPPRNEWGELSGTERPSFFATIMVCRGWRDAAFSNPFLWSTMHIDLGTLMSLSGINDWVLRSRTLPLTLHIQCLDRSKIEQSKKLLADVMNLCSNGLQSLSLHVSSRVLCGLQHNDFQYHRLAQLRICSRINQPLSFLNPTASPEKIKLDSPESFRSLHISWNRLTSVTVSDFKLEDITQLFQQASQMTFCRISLIPSGPGTVSMPPIIHHRLKTLKLRPAYVGVAPDLLGSLTLPCLQEVEIFQFIQLRELSALVRRSSCPLTKLTLHLDQIEFPSGLQPLPGVTDLVVGYDKGGVMKGLLLDEYFPDLCHLTLRLQPFEVLWGIGAIPLLLDRKRPRPDEPNGGRLHKFVVVDQPHFLDHLWKTNVGAQLKELNLTLKEDGFEFF